MKITVASIMSLWLVAQAAAAAGLSTLIQADREDAMKSHSQVSVPLLPRGEAIEYGTQIAEGWKRGEGVEDGTQIAEGWKRGEATEDGTQIAEGWKRDEAVQDGTQIAEGW